MQFTLSNIQTNMTRPTGENIAAKQKADARFLSKIYKSSDCWIYTAGKDWDGYGAFCVTTDGIEFSWRAHRYSYQLHKGPIPDSLLVLHSCDNPSCVNPAHLFVGTSKENTHDMIAKGRRKTVYLKGELSGRAILTAEKVLVARKLHYESKQSFRKIAEFFGVSVGCIQHAVTGKNWKHI